MKVLLPVFFCNNDLLMFARSQSCFPKDTTGEPNHIPKALENTEGLTRRTKFCLLAHESLCLECYVRQERALLALLLYVNYYL